MGGLGSGRDDYATTPTIEESKAIDVNEFTYTLTPGSRGSYRWFRDGEESGDIRWEVTGDAGGERARGQFLRLQFTVTDHQADEQREYDYPVRLEYTECNFGGERPWFRCPGVVEHKQAPLGGGMVEASRETRREEEHTYAEGEFRAFEPGEAVICRQGSGHVHGRIRMLDR